MTIAFERQELRALALQPIRHLPRYSADYTVACRVGTVMAAHTLGLVDPSYSRALDKVLSATALRAIIGPA
ncbi:MAG: hypothetical protein JWR80_5504 [Bradyrhizobium sp.]|nr:hypothetical protein [Bradyrhizobium sp.]